jgi:hypothetical protein
MTATVDGDTRAGDTYVATLRHSRPVDYRDEIIGQRAPAAPWTEHARDLSAVQVGEILAGLRASLCWERAEPPTYVAAEWHAAYELGRVAATLNAIDRVGSAVELADYLEDYAARRGQPRTVATRDQLERLQAALEEVAAAAAELGA